MSGRLLAPLMLAFIAAGATPVASLGYAGVAAALKAGPAAGGLEPGTLAAVAGVSITGAAIGLAGGLLFRRLNATIRAFAIVTAGLILIAPCPGPLDKAHIWPPGLHGLAILGCGTARATALGLLATAYASMTVSPGLRRAAALAGASPFRAWRDAVFRPLFKPALSAVLLGLVSVLPMLRRWPSLPPNAAPAEAWFLPMALLMLCSGVIGLGAMMARTPAR